MNAEFLRKNRKRCFLLAGCIVVASTTVMSQDLIYRKSGEVIRAKVSEIGVSEIVYRRFDNPDGPAYILPVSEIQRIRYENGSEDNFGQGSVTAVIPAPAMKEMPIPTEEAAVPEAFKPYLGAGFNLLLHNGIWGSTVPARPLGGEYTPGGGDSYMGYGFGVNINYRFLQLAAIHFDINNYNNTTPVAYKGGNATSFWVYEMTGYSSHEVGPFTQNANYTVNTTGMRLGFRIYPLKKESFQPWYGMYYGYYTVNLGVYSEDKKQTYGNTNLEVTGLTYMNFGVDFWDKTKSFGGTLFIELGSPVVRNYKIEDCLVNGWIFQDYGEGSHIFGYNRIGLSLNFISRKKQP